MLSVLERGNPKPFKEMTKPCVVKLDETPTNLYAISQRLLVSCLSIECLALGDQGQGRRGGDFPEKRTEIPVKKNEESCRFWKPFDMSTMHLPPCPLVVPKPTGAHQR